MLVRRRVGRRAERSETRLAIARTKHRLPLGERTYTCTACEAASPRDKNSARVMLVRAGLNPAGADGGRRLARCVRVPSSGPTPASCRERQRGRPESCRGGAVRGVRDGRSLRLFQHQRAPLWVRRRQSSRRRGIVLHPSRLLPLTVPRPRPACGVRNQGRSASSPAPAATAGPSPTPHPSCLSDNAAAGTRCRRRFRTGEPSSHTPGRPNWTARPSTRNTAAPGPPEVAR